MMSVKEYSEDINQSIEVIIKKANELGYEVNSEDDIPSEDAVIDLDTALTMNVKEEENDKLARDNEEKASEKETLEEIKLWSDNNPNHLPITILIEPKAEVTEIKDMKNFSVDYANALGETIKNVLGDTLLTPAQMMRDYASFEEMRKIVNKYI